MDSEVPNTFTSNIYGMSPVFIKNGKQVDIPEEFKDVIKSSIDMAKLELKLKSCPLIIKRKLPSGNNFQKTIPKRGIKLKALQFYWRALKGKKLNIQSFSYNIIAIQSLYSFL